MLGPIHQRILFIITSFQFSFFATTNAVFRPCLATFTREFFPQQIFSQIFPFMYKNVKNFVRYHQDFQIKLKKSNVIPDFQAFFQDFCSSWNKKKLNEFRKKFYSRSLRIRVLRVFVFAQRRGRQRGMATGMFSSVGHHRGALSEALVAQVRHKV